MVVILPFETDLNTQVVSHDDLFLPSPKHFLCPTVVTHLQQRPLSPITFGPSPSTTTLFSAHSTESVSNEGSQSPPSPQNPTKTSGSRLCLAHQQRSCHTVQPLAKPPFEQAVGIPFSHRRHLNGCVSACQTRVGSFNSH